MARRLLEIAGVLSLAGSTAGCVIPLDFDGEAASNTAPIVLVDRTQPKPQEDLVVFQSKGQPRDTQEFVLAVRDPDPQPLRVRMFLDGDYSKQLPVTPDVIQAQRQADGTGVTGFALVGLCDELVSSQPGHHLLELYVTDGEYADGRSVVPPALRDNVSWRLECKELAPGP